VSAGVEFSTFLKSMISVLSGLKDITIALTSHQVYVDHDLLHILFDLHLGLHSQGKCHSQANGVRSGTTVVSLIRANWRGYSWMQLNYHRTSNLYQHRISI
jgi:hypothetical protein